MGDEFHVVTPELRRVAAAIQGQADEISAQPMPIGVGDAGTHQLTSALCAVLGDIQDVHAAIVAMLTGRATDLQKAADAYELCDTQLRSGFDGMDVHSGTAAS